MDMKKPTRRESVFLLKYDNSDALLLFVGLPQPRWGFAMTADQLRNPCVKPWDNSGALYWVLLEAETETSIFLSFGV